MAKKKSEFYIGQIFEGMYPSEAAIWANDNNVEIREIEKTEEGVRRFELCEIEPIVPTKEQQKQNRANAYQQEVDPITSHIQRLRDEDPQSEEIEQLLEERAAKVEEIKERYPYPVEE